MAWDAATQTLTITLGSPNRTNGFSSGVSATVPYYTPTSNITDIAGNTMNATAFHGTSSRF